MPNKKVMIIRLIVRLIKKILLNEILLNKIFHYGNLKECLMKVLKSDTRIWKNKKYLLQG